MKEYQFKYTIIRETLVVILLSIATMIISMFLCLYLKLNFIFATAISLGLTYLLFQKLKGKVVHNCTAKLAETSLILEFENNKRIINFKDLTSYKYYSGKNGVILYLNNNIDNFKISSNNYYCKTDDFEVFCNDTITQLDKYRNKYNLALIHEGSIYKTKGMLYFLVFATVIYLLAFMIETKALRIAVGIGGGLYFFIMWTKYFIENKNQLNPKDS